MTKAPSPATRLRRHPERGHYDRAVVDAILDAALISHVGFFDQRPIVIPMIHARVGETLYLHGSPGSRLLRQLATGVDVCATATLVDGLVLARSQYKHSLNYRSVVVFGRARTVDDEEKRIALHALTDHVLLGRADDARSPSDEELTATNVLAVTIAEASAKIRTGPPQDFDYDVTLPIWAGVVPLGVRVGPLKAAPDLDPGVAPPTYIDEYQARTADGRSD